MKFGFISLDFRRFPLEHCFKMAKEYGFNGVEIWGGRPHAYVTDMTPEYIEEIDGYKKKYDIEVPMYTPNTLGGPYNLCVPHSRTRKEALEFYKQSIDITNALEAPRMLVTADHPGHNANAREAWHCLVENLQELCAYAHQRGVCITIEPLTPMESPVVTTSDHCVALLEDVKAPNLDVMMDVVPPIVAYEPFSSYFEKLKDKLSYIHICNSDGKTEAHLRLDQGMIPVTDMFRVFKQWNYQGYVTAELYSENYADPELYLANAARLIWQAREEVGI